MENYLQNRFNGDFKSLILVIILMFFSITGITIHLHQGFQLLVCFLLYLHLELILNYSGKIVLILCLIIFSSCVKEIDITEFTDEYGSFEQELRVEALMLPQDKTAIIRIDKTIAIDDETLFDCEDDNGNWIGSGCRCGDDKEESEEEKPKVKAKAEKKSEGKPKKKKLGFFKSKKKEKK